MGQKQVIEASEAVALGVKMANPGVIGMYPITPQTHIVERLADYINDGELKSQIIFAESEHSSMSACIGASAAGVRTFTSTASQGLAYMHEVLFIASGMRLPIVMAVANRSLSAPINIWNDHQDSVSSRDSGWIQLYAESSQEAIDTAIQAYKIAENQKVMLPVMVCIDGFTLSHVWEPVNVPDQKEVDDFLPKFKPLYTLDPKKPVTMGPIGYPNSFMHFRQEQQKAMENALKVIEEVNKDFSKKFGRRYGNGLADYYKIEDAKYALIAMGTVCSTARGVVDKMREQGKKVGLIKIKSLRPFPSESLVEFTQNLKGVAIIDRAVSPGCTPPLYIEVSSCLKEKDCRIRVKGYVAGLGGRDVTEKIIEKAITNIEIGREIEWLF